MGSCLSACLHLFLSHPCRHNYSGFFLYINLHPLFYLLDLLVFLLCLIDARSNGLLWRNDLPGEIILLYEKPDRQMLYVSKLCLNKTPRPSIRHLALTKSVDVIDHFNWSIIETIHKLGWKFVMSVSLQNCVVGDVGLSTKIIFCCGNSRLLRLKRLQFSLVAPHIFSFCYWWNLRSEVFVAFSVDILLFPQSLFIVNFYIINTKKYNRT